MSVSQLLSRNRFWMFLILRKVLLVCNAVSFEYEYAFLWKIKVCLDCCKRYM